MFFYRETPVRSFNLTVHPGNLDRIIAFGPASILNGSVVLTLERPVSAYNIRVVFKCEQENMQTRERSTLFSVEAYVWGKARSEGEPRELTDGSHMYLFAIKLPHVNYPPSLHGTYIGHHIEYSLQGFADIDDSAAETARVPVMYLPLVTCAPDGKEGAKKTQIFQRNNALVKVTAELIKPAYSPGEPCTVKLITNNHSDCRISHVDVSLVCTTTTVSNNNNNDDSVHHHKKHHTIHSETFYVAIPKECKNHRSVFRFDIPDHCVPTTQNRIGQYLDIAYEIVVSMPLTGASLGNDGTFWPLFGSSYPFTNTISLPVFITTVPASFPVPSQLSLPLPYFSEQPELPSFIPSIDSSPLPSPSRPMFSSPAGSWAGSPNLSPIAPDFVLEPIQQDATGHLMVPSSPRMDGTRDQPRRNSTGSISSASFPTVAVQ